MTTVQPVDMVSLPLPKRVSDVKLNSDSKKQLTGKEDMLRYSAYYVVDAMQPTLAPLSALKSRGIHSA